MSPALLAETGPSIFGPPAVDCDVSITVPSTQVLMKYLDPYWNEAFTLRGIDRTSFTLTGFSPDAPLAARPDWRPQRGAPGTSLSLLQSGALEAFGSRAAIASCLFGGAALHSADMAAVMCRAVNDWVAEEWLDKDTRLRASILVPQNSPTRAIEEIERRIADSRFVQVSMLAGNKELLGKRENWPIYELAQRHELAIGVYGGSLYHHPPATGFGSYQAEDYVARSFAFESQLLSLVSEGVFQKFPDLKIVFAGSGVTWLPSALWRFNKSWRGVRAETPWLNELPADIVRRHIRFTIQPFDAPEFEQGLELFIEQMGSADMLLFATGFPEWHFEGEAALPVSLSDETAKKILFENPLATYPRLAKSIAATEEVLP